MSAAKVSLLQRRFIGVAGDWHGYIGWIKIALQTFAASGITTIIQLGDFGLSGDIIRYLNKINSYLLRLNLWLLVVPGNHENYNFINDDTKFDIDEDGIRWYKNGSDRESRIGLLPRGFTWEQQGRTLMALGGASSIDITHRKKDKSWWEGENITEDEADEIIAGLDGGHVDVMFTHDAPRDVFTLDEYESRTAEDWTLSERAYAGTSRARLDRVFRVAQPKLLMHGHWHQYVNEVGQFESYWDSCGEWEDEVVDVFNSHIVGLDMQNSIDNLAVLDVSSLEVTMLDRETAIETGKPVGERRIFRD